MINVLIKYITTQSNELFLFQAGETVGDAVGMVGETSALCEPYYRQGPTQQACGPQDLSHDQRLARLSGVSNHGLPHIWRLSKNHCRLVLHGSIEPWTSKSPVFKVSHPYFCNRKRQYAFGVRGAPS